MALMKRFGAKKAAFTSTKTRLPRGPKRRKGYAKQIAILPNFAPAKQKSKHKRRSRFIVQEGRSLYGSPDIAGARQKLGIAPNYKVERGRAASSRKRLLSAFAQRMAVLPEAETDVNFLCDSYGLRREELAKLTGFSLRSLADWATGKSLSQSAVRRLREVRRLLGALEDVVKKEAIAPWLRQENPAFDNLAPLRVIEIGEMDRLWGMLNE